MKHVSRFALVLATLTAAACGGGDGNARTLVIYSPHGKDLLSRVERDFESLHPGVDVQTLDMGSQEILDRIRSERANPQADVWFGAPSALFIAGAQDSLLAATQPSWAGALDANQRAADGTWYGTYLTPEVIAFNSDLVPADQVPTDWDQVLDPKWKGRILIRDPLASGTMRTIFGMIMDRSIRATGDTAQGNNWLRRLDAQTKEYVLNPTLLYNKLARGEGVLTLWDMPDIDELRAKTKLPISYVFPTSGTPVVVDAIAVVKNAPNEALAREFVEYIGGIPALAAAARENFRVPARSDFPVDSLPELMRAARERIKPEPLDWQRLQEKTPGWMQFWDEHIRGRNR